MLRADHPTDDIVPTAPRWRAFLAGPSASGVLVVAAAVLALVWANSPWSGSYARVWESSIGVSAAGHTLQMDLRHWLNDGAMTLFFLVIGLEIKRELADGHLASVRAALAPTIVAAGGIALPALVYLAIAGSAVPRGWAVPAATDIALAVALVALLGDRVPPATRAFLLALAVVDDIAAIVVIAFVYSGPVSPAWLAVAAAAFGAAVLVRWSGSTRTAWFVALGAVLWLALHEAGVHATLAGVAMGLLAPAAPHLRAEALDVRELADVSSVAAAHRTRWLAHRAVPVVDSLRHALEPWTGLVLVPVFALANAGVAVSPGALGAAVRSPVAWGVFAGLVVGKPAGVLVAASVAKRAGLDVTAVTPLRRRLGVGCTAGIGFTVALFVTDLAFTDDTHRAAAKIGVLAGSAASAALAVIVLRGRRTAVTP